MSIFKNWYSRLNIYIQLLPFLFLYILICIFFSKNILIGDEIRYLQFVSNILHGNFGEKYAEINLSSGPGYPIFLALFISIKLPIILLRMLNAFLLYFALIFSFKTFCYYTTEKRIFYIDLLTWYLLPNI